MNNNEVIAYDLSRHPTLDQIGRMLDNAFAKFPDAVREYIEYYNNKRIQKKTKWMSPVKYRETSICFS